MICGGGGAMKKAVIVLGVILGLLGIVFLWLGNNVNELVKNAIEKYGSQMTGTKVRVASVTIKATRGVGIVRGLVVDNPPGFRTPYALKVGEISIKLDVASIAKPVVLIQKIAVSSPDLLYEKANGTTNFDAIRKNISENVRSSSGTAREQRNGKKLIVGRLVIRNAKVQASASFMKGRTISFGLPDIALNNIGKSEGGVPPGELGRKIGDALKQKLERTVDFGALARSMGDSLNKATNAIRGFFGR